MLTMEHPRKCAPDCSDHHCPARSNWLRATPPANPPTPAVSTAATSASGTLYAQATANGYQLIDTKPQIVFTILKTSAPETFLAEKGSIHGIVFKKEGDWVFEYYQEGKLLAEKLSIKF